MFELLFLLDARCALVFKALFHGICLPPAFRLLGNFVIACKGHAKITSTYTHKHDGDGDQCSFFPMNNHT